MAADILDVAIELGREFISKVEAYLRCLDMLPDGPVDRGALPDVTP